MAVHAFCQVLVNLLLNKILGDYLLFLCFHYGVFLCHNCSSVIVTFKIKYNK